MKLRSVGLACALVVLAGCGDDDGTGLLLDGGTETDGGSVPADASATDSGTGGSTDTDAGAEPPDAGPVDAYVPPATCETSRIRIEETCEPAFTACGGPVLGNWCYSEICISKNELLEQALMQPGVPAACDVEDITVIRSTGGVDGVLEFSPTSLRRRVETEATGLFHLTRDCMLVNCRATQSALEYALSGTGTASCTNGAPDGCDCEITFRSNLDSTDDYTIQGNTIVLSSGRRFDYCVEDDGGMRFRETGSAIEPGIQTALPR